MLTKIEVARRQLGTALALFLADQDPVSVHALACGGGEIAHRLAELAGAEPFVAHVEATFPDMERRTIWGLRTRYWNPIKHATNKSGADRADDELLAAFTDEVNDHHLLIGWYDYGAASGALPIEAQAFQTWYFAKHPDKLSGAQDPLNFTAHFPGILTMERAEQKAALRQKIAVARTLPEVMDDPRTDRRPLILPP